MALLPAAKLSRAKPFSSLLSDESDAVYARRSSHEIEVCGDLAVDHLAQVDVADCRWTPRVGALAAKVGIPPSPAS